MHDDNNLLDSPHPVQPKQSSGCLTFIVVVFVGALIAFVLALIFFVLMAGDPG